MHVEGAASLNLCKRPADAYMRSCHHPGRGGGGRGREGVCDHEMCAAWVQQILADAELNGDSELARRILGGSELEFLNSLWGLGTE